MWEGKIYLLIYLQITLLAETPDLSRFRSIGIFWGWYRYQYKGIEQFQYPHSSLSLYIYTHIYKAINKNKLWNNQIYIIWTCMYCTNTSVKGLYWLSNYRLQKGALGWMLCDLNSQTSWNFRFWKRTLVSQNSRPTETVKCLFDDEGKEPTRLIVGHCPFPAAPGGQFQSSAKDPIESHENGLSGLRSRKTDLSEFSQ